MEILIYTKEENIRNDKTLFSLFLKSLLKIIDWLSQKQ